MPPKLLLLTLLLTLTSQAFTQEITLFPAFGGFEFYEDDLFPLFHRPVTFLMQHNLSIFTTLCDLIGIETAFDTTLAFDKTPATNDYRHLAIAKKEPSYPLESYTQVLESHHDFLPNLSVLDLLFNEGPNSINYLEAQNLIPSK